MSANDEIDELINNIIVKLKSGQDIGAIKKSMIDDGANIYKLDKALMRSNEQLTNEYQKDIFELLGKNAKRHEIMQHLTNTLPEQLAAHVFDLILNKYKSKVRTLVIKSLKLNARYQEIVDTFQNEYISNDDLKTWVKHYLNNQRIQQKEDKKDKLQKGIGLLLFGVLATVGSYAFAVMNSGGSYFLTYGLIIAGVVKTIDGLMAKVDKEPNF